MQNLESWHDVLDRTSDRDDQRAALLIGMCHAMAFLSGREREAVTDAMRDTAERRAARRRHDETLRAAS